MRVPDLPKAITEIEDPHIQDLLMVYDEDHIEALQLTPSEVKKIKYYMENLKAGSHSQTPMICTGDVCICHLACPLNVIRKPPLGKQCPFEKFAMNFWLKEYTASLKIDLKDKVEQSLVMDLVEADIFNARANAVIAAEGFIMNNPVGVDPGTGDVIMRRERSIAMDIKEWAQNRKDKILKSFLATREAKIKSTQGEDPTEYMARLRQAAEKLQREHDKSIIDIPTKEEQQSTTQKETK